MVFFFLEEAAGDDSMVGACVEAGSYVDRGVSGVVAGTVFCFLTGEMVAGLDSPDLGDFFSFCGSLRSSPRGSLFWAGPCSSLFGCLLVVVVVTVVVSAFVSFCWIFLGQNLAMWPICLHPQQRGRLPSTTTTIICRSLLTVPPLVARHPKSQNFWANL